MFVIGLDLGTTGCKAIVFDEQGNIKGDAYIEYPLIISDNQIEQDANLWWELCCKTVRQAMTFGKIPEEEVLALAVSSQGISFVPVDKNLEPLCNAITWLDKRAEEECDLIRSLYSNEEIFKLTGKRNNAIYNLPKIIWLKEHNTNIFKQTFKLLMAHDYIVAKMTGHCVTDHSLASGTMLYDINKREWSIKLMDDLSINIELLPEIYDTGSIVGHLTKNAAKLLGLTTNTIVVIGGQDQKVAASFVKPEINQATLSLGTAGAMEFISNKPLFDDGMRIQCFSYIYKNQWAMEAVVSTTGASLKWLKNNLLTELSYKEMDDLCEQSGPGANGCMFFPHLSGATSPHWNLEQKGMLSGITLDTTASDIIRSVMEGIAFQLKHNLNIYESIGEKIDCIHVFGGGASSKIWCRIICDILQVPLIIYSTPEIALFGAGKIACNSLSGQSDSFGISIINQSLRFEPQINEGKVYGKMYAGYIEKEQKLFS